MDNAIEDFMASMNSRGGAFPTTDWGLFVDIRGGNPAAKQAALDILAQRYWKPVFRFLQYSGKDDESAKVLSQAFFATWIESNTFAKADEQRGKFRSFMLASLKRFASNEYRAEQAQKRRLELDIEPHRRWMNESQPPLDEKFKDPYDPLRLVFLCAMWLTGFDVPSCSIIYLDKPMQNHTLMQTIARAKVRLAIDDALDGGPPQPYTPEIYQAKCSAVFKHVYESYYGEEMGIYASA